MLASVMDGLVHELQNDLGIQGGRLYRREGEHLVLTTGMGTSASLSAGFRLPPDFLPQRRVLEEGTILMGPDDPGLDERVLRAIGISSTFAAIAVGENNSHVLAFSLRDTVDEERILYALTTLRHVINLKCEQMKLRALLEETRISQEKLLPTAPPSFPGFDIFGFSRPTEIVGGDILDYLVLSPRSLAVAVGDASGHGLPAAALARDVITGLRMGLDKRQSLARTMESLNRVVHRSTHSNRFATLFCGRLHRDASLTFCNAGHVPPLLQRGLAVEELREGGLILGPDPGARYASGKVHLRPGDVLLLYTDGLTELEDRRGREFGVTRLRWALQRVRATSAREIVETILLEVDEHAAGAPQRDDLTLVAVRRTD
jgi:serine phosphatase RsbU (regulator of sigma subunit)